MQALALPELRTLLISSNEIADCGPLAAAAKLETLSIGDNPLVAGVDAFGMHPSLRAVFLEATGRSAVPIVAPAILEVLHLDHNAIVDVDPLGAYQALHSVHLDANAITTLAPLVDDPWITECDLLSVGDNPLDAETLVQVIPALCEALLDVQGPPLDACTRCGAPP
ncbi:hypothetical protein SAMN02745121_07971 [Nannocystis exedens]|uniref:Leucine Rich repeat-containing protein n=1 Tax=Nannocystis exedens TaxID=54 RepID=A0A1I2HGL3_9BACT|nr:hypothetical protein SAMN02745121_07971 [Nannocystis exedens]